MKRNYYILLAVFFVSGMAGLIYEIVWSKYLALFLGATGYAQLLVLATFMGGLALGAWRLGARADRTQRPLLYYVWLELGLAAWGLLFPVLFPFVRQAFLALVQNLGLELGAIFLLKIPVCIVLILIPTMLMGGTLPVMVRVMTSSLAAVGRNVSSLYFINSMGAAVGCLLAGFVLIPGFGLPGANQLAAFGNLLAALAALWVYFGLRGRGAPLGHSAPVAAAAYNLVAEPRRIRRLALWTIAVSGGLAMLYEVTWIRLLTLTIGSSTYSFSLMLAAFISGLALGSWLLTFKRSPRGYFFTLGASELAIGALVLLSLPVYQVLPIIFNHWSWMLNRTPEAFPVYQAIKLAVCFLVMLPPAIFFGMTLPAASHVVGERLEILGRKVGGAFAINTLGAIVGTILTGLILLPHLGLQGTLILGIAGNFLLGFLVLFTSPASPWVNRLRLIGLAFLICGGASYAPLSQSWSNQLLNSGLFRMSGRFANEKSVAPLIAKQKNIIPAYCQEEKRKSTKSSSELSADSLLRYQRDGVNSSVAVFEYFRAPGNYYLTINGKTDASTLGDLPTQMLIAHLPLIIKDDARRALIIGLGCGVTMGSALRHPLEELDVVEISPEVVEAAELWFSDFNYACIKDGQAADTTATLYLEDAKTFLQITPKKYDVIISEPSNPWVAGMAGLFTDEFFQECAAHLTEDGVLVQWVQLYEFEDRAIQLIFDTLQKTFPHVLLWASSRADMVLIASRQPFTPDFAAMERAIARPEVNADLARIGIRSLQTLLMMQLGELPPPAGPPEPWQLNSDYRMRLEYIAPVGFFLRRRAPMAETLDMRFDPLAADRLWLASYQPAEPPSADEFYAYYCQIHNLELLRKDLARPWARLWTEAWPDDVRGQLALICESPGGLFRKRELFEEQLLPDSEDPDVWATYVEVLVALREQDRTMLLERRDDAYEGALRQCLELVGGRSWRADCRYWALLADYFLETYRFAEADEAVREALALTPTDDPSKADSSSIEAVRRQLEELQGKIQRYVDFN